MTEKLSERIIPLTQGKVTIVDEDDYRKFKNRSLHAVNYKGWWYAEVTIGKHGQLLHRLILNAKKGEMCDHVNGDGLDNRKSNLRIVSNSQNIMNSKKTTRKGVTSQFKGVYWSVYHKKWVARVRLNYVYQVLGFYDNELDAAYAYDEGATKIFGEYAKLNFQEVKI